MKIAIDFDGTCVKHEYPEVGGDCPHAVEFLSRLAREGHELILYTMRSGKELQDAIQWFESNEIPLSAVGKSKGQEKWTSSNKCYAQLYIDDAALGCPLVYPAGNAEGRPYVNWKEVERIWERTYGVQ